MSTCIKFPFFVKTTIKSKINDFVANYLIKKGGFMVKGVSKTIIEVNDTGSRLFEKIVFYVTPEYGNLNAKQLKRAASNFSFHYTERKQNSLRHRRFRKKAIYILTSIFSALTIALILFLVF